MATKLSLAAIFSAPPTSGGGYDYEAAVEKMLLDNEARWGITVRCLSYDKNLGLKENGSDSPLDETLMGNFPRSRRRLRSWFQKRSQSAESALTAAGVDLVYFVSPSLLASHLVDIPFISTVWDLGHRELPEFPEFRGSTWATREHLYRSTLPRSFHILTDSTTTGDSISRIYGVPRNRWSSMGLLYPSLQQSSLETAIDNTFPSEYFVYPAKKWPHKNHVVLLYALREVLRDFPAAKLVFTGSSEGGAYPAIQEKIQELGLSENVVDRGFVNHRDYINILSKAAALVMPSYLGPTNIPPLQALELGTPAIVSDSHFFEPYIQDQMVVVPAENPELWANAMRKSILGSRTEPLKRDTGPSEAVLQTVFANFAEKRTRWTKG